MLTKICKDCKKKFEAKPNLRFPRRYCDKCSAQRKKDYANIHLITAEDCVDA